MTELIWDGKYKDGKKTAPVRISLPFQTIETINESAADRQKRLGSLFNQKQNPGEWRNRLIWGDKKYVLPSLLAEFAGKINLIYIDPPFNVGSDFSFTATIPDHPESEEDETTTFIKQPSIIEQKAYRDTWGRGLDSYLQWFYETVVVLRELLTEDGSIYIHLDWHIGHYAKIVMDEVFGYNNFLNNIVWCYKTRQFSKKYWNRKHDDILFYSKSDKWTFNWESVMSPLSESTIKKYKLVDEQGRKYRLSGRGITGSPIKSAKDVDAKWEITNPELVVRDFLRDGYPPEDWWLIDILNQVANERVEYATQKPETMLERIIKASSNEGDLVLDCFCGSGTTAAVAEKLNRRWITCDLGRFAIHTTRKRLLGITDVKPFVVQNLGKYERQQWVQAEFENPADRLEQERAYKKFICELYHAKALEGYTWLHGAKAGRMIHVGSVEAPVTVEDVKASILEFWKLIGKEKSAETNGIDFLGWDFAFEVNETAAQFAKSNKVDVKFKKIPREVLEKKAVDQGDIKFYELASLKVKTKIAKQQLTVTLENFIIPPDDVPEEVRGSITHWSQWIDYWSIDWNYKDDTFHNEWQSYRTKQNPKIDLTAYNHYEEKGKYTLLVKVIDILGNDTTKAITIEIA
ncbi:MAG: site-specific DNA-methyltransferase [Ignavibacteriaceae bacterium]|nr:site-specific DNA-methyltransferase [Ignavibacteriaceae bacterium]